MPRQKRDIDQRPLPTIWRVPNELWTKVEAILSRYDPPQRTGRKRIDTRP